VDQLFSEIKKLLKHSSIYGSANLLQKGIGFIMIPLYTHYLSPADYGVLELMDLTINVTSMLMGMGIGSAIIRFYHHYESPGDKVEVFTTAFIFMAVVCLIAVGISEWFAKPISRLVLGKLEYYRYFQVIFVSMGLQTLASVPESLLLAKKQSVIFSAISIGTLISYLTFNILFLVAFKMGVIGILLSMLITKILNNSSLLMITFRHTRLNFSLKKLEEMVNFGLPLVPAGIGMFIMHFSDRFFVQKLCSLNDLGLYSLGYKFGMIISIIVTEPIFRIWNTQRFEIAKTDHGKQVVGRIFTYYSTVIIFAGLGISIFIKEIMFIMAAQGFQEATVVVPLVALGYILYGMANYFTLGMMITKRTKYIAWVQLSAAGISILFNALFISRYGVMGAATSTVLSFLFLAIFSFIISQRLYPIPFEYGRVSILFALAMSIFGLSRWIEVPLLMSVGVKTLLILGFPVILFLGGFFYEDEISNGRELLRGVTSRWGIRISLIRMTKGIKR
jgi:O-antigen/teichoic acid export membrane protein